MNLFGVGPAELLLIVIIAAVVLGPERLPIAAVQVARAIRFLRGYATDATSQLRQEMNELAKEYEEVRKELDEFKLSVRGSTAPVTDAISRLLAETKPAIDDAGRAVNGGAPIIEPGGELPPPERLQR